MTYERDRYFFYGGIFSLSFFSFLLLLILWKSSVEEKTVLFATNLGEVISVSLSDAPVVMDSVAVADSQPQVDEPHESVSPKELFISETKREEKEEPVELGDLFSTVKPTKTVTKKQDNSAQLKEITELENKILSSKRDSKLFDKVNKLDFAKPSVQMVASGSTGPEVNAYNAKIQGVVLANFHPVMGSEGFKARIHIALSKEGKLESYKVVSYSNNRVFNSEVDWLKERLRQVDLPPHPLGQDAEFEIMLSAKDLR